MNLLREIKERKIRKWLAIYTSASITILGLVHLFSIRYELPRFIFDVVLIIIAGGIFSVFLIAWHHGKEGPQKIKKKEIVLHSMIVVIVLTIIGIKIFSINTYPEFKERSIAVLPFENLSDSKEDEYFSDGVTEDILTYLSKISDLRVISRTTVMKYKNTDLSIPEIGKELGVQSILEGSVRRSGNRIRIVSQLIDARKDEPIWSETFDRNMDDIFEIQTEVARNIAASLKAELTEEEEKLIKEVPTESTEAYALYLLGRKYYNDYSFENNEKAVEYFKKCLSIDSTYALAYAGLGDAYCQKVTKFWLSRNWLDSSLIVSKKALEINPLLAEGYKALGFAYDTQGKYGLAASNYRRAIKLNPNFQTAINNLGQIELLKGNVEEAYGLLKKSVRLAPDYVYGYITVGWVFQRLAMDSLAMAWFEKAKQLDPQNLFILNIFGWQYIYMGDLEKARIYSDSLITSAPNWMLGIDLAANMEMLSGNFQKAYDYYLRALNDSIVEPNFNTAFLMMKTGNDNGARQVLQDNLNTNISIIEKGNESFWPRIENTVICSVLNQKEEAYSWLEKAIETGWLDYRWARIDPIMENLHGDKKFDEYMKSVETNVSLLRLKIEVKLQEESKLIRE